MERGHEQTKHPKSQPINQSTRIIYLPTVTVRAQRIQIKPIGDHPPISVYVQMIGWPTFKLSPSSPSPLYTLPEPSSSRAVTLPPILTASKALSLTILLKPEPEYARTRFRKHHPLSRTASWLRKRWYMLCMMRWSVAWLRSSSDNLAVGTNHRGMYVSLPRDSPLSLRLRSDFKLRSTLYALIMMA